MRDYQTVKNLHLPKTVYNRTIAFIRDFERVKNDYDEIILCLGGYSLEGGGGGKGSVSSPVESAALKRIKRWKDDIEAVEKAMMYVPKEYRKAVIHKCLYDRYGNKEIFFASERTLGRWKAVFIYALAEELGFI